MVTRYFDGKYISGRKRRARWLAATGLSDVPFVTSFTGLTGGEARIGDHGSIGYTIDPDNGTETIKWSYSSDKDAAGIGTAANPPDFAAGDGGQLWQHVTDDGVTVSRAAPIRYAPGTFAALVNQSFTDDTGNQTYVFDAATGTGLTWTYSLVSPPAGVSIVSATRTITFDTDALAAQAGTVITVRAVDQYGRNPGDRTFTLTISEPGTGSITFSAEYTPGGSGEGPRVTISDLILTDTTGPYDIFLATHANGTTLTASQVIAGTGDTEDAVSILDDADGEVVNEPLPLSTSLTNGHLSIVIRDASDPAVVGLVTLNGINVDATAPVLSEPTASQTGTSDATWGVRSDKAGGTVYATARASAGAVLTAEEIIAQVVGVDQDTDATMTADATNGGSHTGLAAETAYKTDIVAVDDWGNVSNVVTSAEFTTAAASGAVVSGTTGSPTITPSYDNDGTIGTLYDFAADGTITFSTGGEVEYAMVGGGAPGGMTGGAARAGGGGGAGKVRQGLTTVSAAALSVVVAAQTNQATNPADEPRQAGSSSFNSIVAPGGWEGGHFTGGVGDPGGSGVDGHGGGGAGGSSAAGGTGDTGYNSGGDGASNNNAGGGAGDGADGGAASVDPSLPGAGGAGTSIDLTGDTWGKGGDGWSQSETPTAAPGANPGDGGDGTNNANLVGHGAAGRVLIFVPD
jgi:hypothetical protein